MKRSSAPLALLLVLALLPATAAAAVRCVPTAGPGCDSGHVNIGVAVNLAANGDTIRIAAGTYQETIVTDKRLAFVGAGGGTLESAAGTTTIAPTSSGAPLSMSNGGTVRGLRLVGLSGSMGSTALSLSPSVNGSYSYVLDDVVAIGGSGFDVIFGLGGTGLSVASPGPAALVQLTVTDSEFKGGSSSTFIPGYGASLSGIALDATLTRTRTVGADAGSGATALVMSTGELTLADSTVRGGTGAQFYDGDSTILRSRIEGVGGSSNSGTGVMVTDQSTVTPTTELDIVDSLVISTPTVEIFQAFPVYAQTYDTGNAINVAVRNSTLIARGADPDAAVAAVRQSNSSPLARADLYNSVARVEGPLELGEGDLFADRGTVTATSSAFSSAATANGGFVTNPGTGTNLPGDPKLDAGFAPLASSPLIDRGDQSFVTAGELDLARRARSLDGNGDCVARADIGAFEYPSQCVPAAKNEAPEILELSLLRKWFTARKPKHSGRKRGTAFNVALSEAARLKIVFARASTGRRVKAKGKRRCVKRTARNRAKPSCTRWTYAGALTRQATAGANKIAFSGRLAGKALKPGRYRATLTATDTAGFASPSRRVTFKVLRP